MATCSCDRGGEALPNGNGWNRLLGHSYIKTTLRCFTYNQ